MCKTHWSESDISYENFYRAIPFMVEAFETMNGTYPKNNGITQNLQGRSTDIIKAYNEVEGCIQDMQRMKQTIDEEFHKTYTQTERLAEKLHLGPTFPRSAVR